jgi:fatty acid desaturase
VLCDTESTDVLRNTRTISGSRLSQWYTNGNNFHVEHHAAMAVPINRLSERHPLAKSLAKHTEHSYLEFYRRILQEARLNARNRSDTPSASATESRTQNGSFTKL